MRDILPEIEQSIDRDIRDILPEITVTEQPNEDLKATQK